MMEDNGASALPVAPTLPTAKDAGEGEGFIFAAPRVCELVKMVWMPKVLESISPTHRFLVLQGILYCAAGCTFMGSPWLASLLFTFGQLPSEVCQAEISARVCTPGHIGGTLSSGLLRDTKDCLCDQERKLLQFASFSAVVVGYLYIQLARGNTLHFVGASIFNRMVLVTLLFFIGWLCGAHLALCLLYALLDPLLCLLTVLSLKGSKLIPRYFRRTKEPVRTATNNVLEHPPGCFKLLWISFDQVEDVDVRLSPTHRWMTFSGALCMLFGILCFTFPAIGVPLYTIGTQTLEDMSDGDISMFRLCGAGLVFSGYLYAQGSRCNSVHIVSTFLFGHLVLQPLGSLALWALGARPEMCTFQAGLSVVLGLLACASLHGVCIPCFAMSSHHSFRGSELVTNGTRVRQSVP